MSNLYWYNTGTVTLANNTSVTGSGTLWSTAAQAGDWFSHDAATWYEIVAITDDTHLTLDRNYAGSTGSGQAYYIARASALRGNSTNASWQLSDFMTTYRSLINMTAADRVFTLDKTATGDNAGLWLKQGGTSLFRIGAFGDADLHFQWLNGSTWTDALKITYGGVLSFPSATGITSSSAQAFFAGRQGATSPAFSVDASASSSATGWKVTAAAAAGGAALSVTSSGTNENATIDAKGSGTLTLQGTATGGVVISRALTYGGVALSNAVTGTGNMVLSAAPTISGTLTLSGTTMALASGHVMNWNSSNYTLTHSSGLLTTSGDFTVGGQNFHLSGSGDAKLYLDSSGASKAPYILFRQGGTTKWTVVNDYSSDRLYIYDSTFGSYGVYIAQSSTSWSAVSDRRLPWKADRTVLTVLDKLDGFEAFDFAGREPGVLAQDLYSIFPALVDKGDDHDSVISNQWGVKYDRLGVVALKGVKELAAQLASAEARIAVLEAA